MNRPSCSKLSKPLTRLAFVICGIMLAGCERDEIKVYRAPKESPPAQRMAEDSHAGHAEAVHTPQVTWNLPAGWKEAGAGQMSLATFNITDKDGKTAHVTVTPLRGLAGKELAIVNMWREQVGQPALTPEEVTNQLQSVEIGGEPGKMFEVIGKGEGQQDMRIVTAMTHRSDASWFYKLQGDAQVVDAQKPAFISFLKSIKIAETPEPSTAGTSVATSGDNAATKWNAPADWTAMPPGSMQVAKFAVPQKNSAKAEVTISIFPNSTGGTLANVNRWRNQIQLPETNETELASMVSPLDKANPDAVLVDMTNGNRRLIGAIVPRGEQWYFYKLLGDAEAVAPQKEAFVAFAKRQS